MARRPAPAANLARFPQKPHHPHPSSMVRVWPTSPAMARLMRHPNGHGFNSNDGSGHSPNERLHHAAARGRRYLVDGARASPRRRKSSSSA